MEQGSTQKNRDSEIQRLALKLRKVFEVLNDHFLDKQEIIRLLIVSTLAGEHALIVGPPGTAKSALIRLFSRLLDSRYFEYLLTRFTEPNELFGPVDIGEFREGRYRRRTNKMLPEAEIVFLDEIFKSNSAILNSLLMMINERIFTNGSEVVETPLLSVFAASNEVPNDENLTAIFDRFLLRVRSENLNSYHFHELLKKGKKVEKEKRKKEKIVPMVSADELRHVQANLMDWVEFSDDFLAKYKGLVFQIRSEGISMSDRRVVKMLKLFAASALFEGRRKAEDGDFFVLRHVWNNLDQSDLLKELVDPLLASYNQSLPDNGRRYESASKLEDLLAELNLVRDLLTGGEPLNDVQLFSQLKNLSDIKAALQLQQNETGRHMLKQVDELLENVFSSSKFGL